MSHAPRRDPQSSPIQRPQFSRAFFFAVSGAAACVLVFVACTSLAPSVARAPRHPAASSPDAGTADEVGDAGPRESRSRSATLSETITGDLPPGAIGHVEDYGSGHSLDALFSTWASLRKSPPEGRGLLLMLGDSHTAGDALTGHLRHRLQREFGDAGRGYLLPGKPVHHYYQKDAEYHTRGAWLVDKGLKREAEEPLGMAGVRIHAASPDAEVTVGTCATCKAGRSVSRFEIAYHPRKDGGKLAYRLDEGEWQNIETRSPENSQANSPDRKPESGGNVEAEGTSPIQPGTQPGIHKDPTAYLELHVPDGSHQLALRPFGDGPIDLFGVALERDVPGMIVDSIGYVGARAYHLHKWDWDYVGPQVAHRNPSLVVLQYGTNETDERELDLHRLEQHFVDLVDRVRAAAPTASILILGPPDRAMRERHDCDPPSKKKGKNKGASKKVGNPKSASKPAAKPNAAANEKPGAPLPGCEWKTPSILIAIIAAERRAAERTHVAFFDLYAALGGQDRMEQFVKAEPPLAYKDRTHLTRLGYERAGDLILAALYSAYDAWAAAAPSTSPPEASATLGASSASPVPSSSPASTAPPAAPSSASAKATASPSSSPLIDAGPHAADAGAPTSDPDELPANLGADPVDDAAASD